ncbi:uncharacterized protein [Typha angustifolia]|uniref:uncharacterized protein n=1 Tax=Typha angustifolia TaxID=59011 RepID=UPI003C30B6F2
MANHDKRNGWMSVPQFGGWDQKTGTPDYSLVFSQARAKRKQHKREMTRASIGAEQELMAYQRYQDYRPPKRSKLSRYLSCCFG